MARKIRVYELARELGLSNKEGLDLCLSMGIGVKSHSSSIEEAQADRVRRRAERDGLKRVAAPAPDEAPASAGSAEPGLAVRSQREPGPSSGATGEAPPA
ncbi:MAG: translation initiation factor IF-2 N-terminal domain-containing protein, partial [Acidimicrobiales bacterium]